MRGCQKCGAAISYTSADAEYCTSGHRQYVFTTYDQRPANTAELTETELTDDEKMALERLGYQFACAA